jgi:hypothetical protein
MAAAAGNARAAEKETRDFSIYVDNKKAGSCQMVIHGPDNGVAVVTAKASLTVTHLLYRYSYSYDGTETWKEGRLLSLKSRTNDNGKKFEVVAAAENKGLRVTVNGRQRLTRGDVWLTSYWHMPEGEARNQAVALIDADTGRDINGRLQYIGLELVTVAGQQVKCHHYRLTGTPAPVDLWYDGDRRLVRQATVEQGHKTFIILTAVQRAENR